MSARYFLSIAMIAVIAASYPKLARAMKVFTAEYKLVLVHENVNIFNPSVTKYESLPFFNALDIFSRESGFVTSDRKTEIRFVSFPNYHFNCQATVPHLARWRRPFCRNVITNFDKYTSRSNIGWTFPIISQNDASLRYRISSPQTNWRQGFNNADWHQFFYKDVGALNVLDGALRKVSLLPSDLDLFDRGKGRGLGRFRTNASRVISTDQEPYLNRRNDNKGTCKNCQHECEERDGIVRRPFPESVKLIIVGGFFLGIFGMLLLAWLFGWIRNLDRQYARHDSASNGEHGDPATPHSKRPRD